MAAPQITFFSELECEQLKAIFCDQVVNDLVAMKANISLGILDLSMERAELVKKLNQAGVPVIAWLLLPKEQGYWFNSGNAPFAHARYHAFLKWTEEQGLVWDGVGLDIEPDIRDLVRFSRSRLKMIPEALKRLFNFKQLRVGRKEYIRLVDKIRSDGYRVDSYQLPLIADERQARSTIIQRITGVVDLPVDREVWMLYSSFVRPKGAGVLISYAAEAQSVALGVTGGGVDEGIINQQPLTWDELARDLRLAWYYCDDIHIFSLEGCVQQGFIDRLKEFTWDAPILTPEESLSDVENWRWLLRVALWFVSHIGVLVIFIISTLLIRNGINCLLKRKRVN